MKKLALLLVGAGLFTIAATKSDATMDKFSGTLVDTKCYSMMPKANAGNEHMVMQDGKSMKMPACATACSNMGIPVALVDGKGKTHVLAVPAGQLADHMAKEARVEGKVMAGVLIPDKIEVKSGNKWEEVKIMTMM